MHYDKNASKIKGKRRIPERTLFAICVLGGSLSVFIGMYLFRHKTMHKRFIFGVPVIIILQVILILYFI